MNHILVARIRIPRACLQEPPNGARLYGSSDRKCGQPTDLSTRLRNITILAREWQRPITSLHAARARQSWHGEVRMGRRFVTHECAQRWPHGKSMSSKPPVGSMSTSWTPVRCIWQCIWLYPARTADGSPGNHPRIIVLAVQHAPSRSV